MIGHICILPFIYIYLSNPTSEQKHDLAMLVAPLTAAYFITITKFVIDNAQNLDLGNERINALYGIGSALIVLPFLVSIYVLLYSLDETTIDFSQAKGGIAMIEVFFGSAFALFVDSLFSKPQAATGADLDVTKPELDGTKDQPLLGGIGV
jgi:hypothetical protein